MSENTNEVAVTSKNPVKLFFDRPEVQSKFLDLMNNDKQKKTAFITSVLQIVASNSLLMKADANSIYQCAAVAATLNLPLNNNLGFAYIIPYNNKQPDGTFKTVAQFQIGYKGFIQLAQRSGQFKSINAAPIYKGQIKNENALDGYEFDFTVKSDELVGYAAKFKLINGYEAVLFMTVEQLKKHGGKYSKTFTQTFGLWTTDFDAMAQKTVLKLLLAKYAPLSIDMQKAVMTDQSMIVNADEEKFIYIDNEETVIDKEAERAVLMINDCKSVNELMKIKEQLPESALEAYETKMNSFLED